MTLPATLFLPLLDGCDLKFSLLIFLAYRGIFCYNACDLRGRASRVRFSFFREAVSLPQEIDGEGCENQPLCRNRDTR